MLKIILLVLFSLVVFILILFTFLNWLSKRGGPKRTNKEVADIIEKFINGTCSDYDWDDFLCVPINEPNLDLIRKRCVKLYDEFPEKGKYCSDKGTEVLKNLIKELREKTN